MIAVCIPAINEAPTIGDICEAISQNAWDFEIDLVVIDGGSVDGTPEIAKAAGARVVRPPKKLGKGAALYESVLQTEAEVIVWCDADLMSFTPDIITKLCTPLVQDSNTMLVKGFYANRKLGEMENSGGRTSWLMARPLLSFLFQEIAHIKEPLSGEYAIRRQAAESVPFVCGYGVEIGLLIDISKKFGVESIGEVDLGTREHKNRPLEELCIQALEILQTAIFKAEIYNPDDKKTDGEEIASLSNSLKSFSSTLQRPGFQNQEVSFEQLPPIKP